MVNQCYNCRIALVPGNYGRCKECGRHRQTLFRAVEGEKFYAFLAEDKCITGCEECGYGKGEKDKACALDYDHLNPQDKNIDMAQLARSCTTLETSIERFQLERPKCRVLCSNCHRLHTREQLQENKEQTLLEATEYFANFHHIELKPYIKSRLYELVNIQQELPSQMELNI